MNMFNCSTLRPVAPRDCASLVLVEVAGDECDQDARSLAEQDTRRLVVNHDHAAFPEPRRPIPYWARNVWENRFACGRTGKAA